MSQENVTLARRVLDALASGMPRSWSRSRPGMSGHSFFALNQEGVYRGHDGTRQYMRDVADGL